MKITKNFLVHIESMRTPLNTKVIDAVLASYQSLTEYNETASASPNFSNETTYMDNTLNINPNSTGFQDNIMEDADPFAQGNPEEGAVDAQLGLEPLEEGVEGQQELQQVPLTPEEVQLIKDYRNQKRAAKVQQSQLEGTLQEFSPPADVIAGSSGPMIKDANPFESEEGIKRDVNQLKSMYIQLANVLNKLEDMINSENDTVSDDAEYIMEHEG